MPSSHDELHETISRLHDELAAAQIDAATADELRSAVADIEQALTRRDESRDDAETNEVPGGDSQAAASQSRLSETARAFEGSHPILSRTISQIVDMLGQMGI